MLMLLAGFLCEMWFVYSNNIRIQLVRTLIFRMFLYRVETWTIQNADRRRLAAFEKLCWRWMLRIERHTNSYSWMAHHRNVSVLSKLNMQICLQHIFEFFGHIALWEEGSLERIILLGTLKEGAEVGPQWDGQIRYKMPSIPPSMKHWEEQKIDINGKGLLEISKDHYPQSWGTD